MREIFLKLASSSENSFLMIENNYKVEKEYNLSNKKRLNNLNTCIKIAIYSEAELIENLFSLDERFCNLPCIHLNNIKTLTSL